MARKKRRYKIADLEQNSRLYDANFKLLLASVGTSEHRRYAREENRLENNCIEIQKDLGRFVNDPCELRLNISCEDCQPRHREGKKCNLLKNLQTMLIGGEKQ